MRVRLLTLLMLLLVLAPLARAQTTLTGIYKLVSFKAYYDDGKSGDFFGATPVGYIIITPTRFMAVLTSDTRKAGRADADKVALYNSMIAYTGPYKLEGSRLVTAVEVSWNQAWTGTAQGRTWKLEGNTLTLTTDRAPSMRDPAIMAYATLVWEKVE